MRGRDRFGDVRASSFVSVDAAGESEGPSTELMASPRFVFDFDGR